MFSYLLIAELAKLDGSIAISELELECGWRKKTL